MSNFTPKSRLGAVLRAPKRWPIFQQWALGFLDFSIITSACLLALDFRTLLPIFEAADDLQDVVAPLAPFLVLGWPLLLVFTGSYNRKFLGYGLLEYRRVLVASLIAATSLGVGCYLAKFQLSRGFYALFFLFGTTLLILGRFTARRFLHLVRKRNLAIIPVLLGGDDQHVATMAQILKRESWLGYRVRGVLLPEGSASDEVTTLGLPVLGTPDDCFAAISATKTEAVIFTEGAFANPRDFNLVARDLEDLSARLIVAPALTDISASRMELRPVAGISLMHIESPRARDAGRWRKRVFDVAGSLILLPIFGILFMLPTALVIKLSDRGPIFFRQRRVGLKGRPFQMWKFRSMCVDAEAKKTELLAQNESDGGVLFKLEDDPRVTRIGRFIRRTSIDELPNLFNVLVGEMSLVGPRPALPDEVAKYEPEMLRRLDVRPGMTGAWQVSGRSDLSWEETVRLDTSYVDNWSMLEDINILIKTVRVVLGSRGAY